MYCFFGYTLQFWVTAIILAQQIATTVPSWKISCHWTPYLQSCTCKMWGVGCNESLEV